MKNIGLNELRIYYKLPRGINTELDKALGKTLKDFGFDWCASGCDTKTGIRDICFDKEDLVQIKNPKTGRYVKISCTLGAIIEHKKTDGPYEGIKIVEMEQEK